jgi:hypothetical protein
MNVERKFNNEIIFIIIIIEKLYNKCILFKILVFILILSYFIFLISIFHVVYLIF